METMREIWRLKERYPKSDPYEIHDSFENGFSSGYAAGHKDGVKEGREDMNLQDVTARSYSQGYEDGYEAGYNEATEHWQEDCRQLRDSLRAILDRGETPEESGSKADRG